MVAVIDRKLWTYAVISLLSIGVMKTTAIANEWPCRGCCLECHQMYEELWLHHITKPNFVCLYVKKMLRFINVNFYHICLLSFYESRIFNCIITGNGGVGRHISTLEYVIAIEATKHRRGSGCSSEIVSSPEVTTIHTLTSHIVHRPSSWWEFWRGCWHHCSRSSTRLSPRHLTTRTRTRTSLHAILPDCAILQRSHKIAVVRQ